MEPSSNPPTETLLRNPDNQKRPMEKFQNVVLKLAQTLPNAPLTPAARALLQDRLNQFVSHYKTPDHPPYSAMIERAIRELNEKQGSSEDSISRFLEREYNNLPWAHSAMLKRHLGNLCVSGDIVVTHNKRYKLPGEIPVPDPPNTKVKRDPPRRRRRRWRWDWEKDKLRRLKKKKLAMLRIQQRGKKAKTVEIHQELDERDNTLILENDGNPISRDITILQNLEQQDGQQSEDTSPKILNPPSFDSTCFKDLPNLDLVEVELMSADKLFERHQEHDGKGRQLMGEIGQNPVSSDITILVAQANVASVHKKEQPEISEPLGCDSSRVKNLHNLSSAEVEPMSAEDLFNSERACRQLRRWNPSQPLGCDSSRVKNLHNLGSAEVEPMPAEDLFNSERERRQLRRWNLSHPEFKAVVSMGSVELVTSDGSEENHSLLPRHSNLEMPLKTPDPNPDQKHCENDSMPVKVDEVYSRRMSEEVEPYFKKTDSPNLPLTSSPAEIVPSNGKGPQELPPQHKNVSQPRRSPRLSLAKPKLTEVVDYVIALPTQQCCEDCPKINPSEEKPQELPPQHRKVSQPRRSPRLSLAKSKLTEVVDYVIALPTQQCREACPKTNPSEEKPVEPIKPADCLEKPTGQCVGSPSKRLCAGPNNKDVMMSSDDGLGGQDPGQTPKRGRHRRPSKANT